MLASNTAVQDRPTKAIPVQVPPVKTTLWHTEGDQVLLGFHEGQARAWKSDKRFVFVFAGSQAGKAIPIDEVLPTPTGWKRMGDVQVGDQVFTEDGSPCTVTFTTTTMHDHDCYQLAFDDGCQIIADGDHQWRTQSYLQRMTRPLEYSVIDTHQIKRTLYFKGHTGLLNHSIDTCLKLSPDAPTRRCVQSVKPVPSVPVCCIQVDSPNGTYLVGKDYIVTHNTSFGPWWLHREIQEHGAGDYLAVTSTYGLFKLKMLPEMRTVYEDILGIGRFWAGAGIIELADPKTRTFGAKKASDSHKMWGRIILRSASSSAGLESATAKAAWMDECGQDRFELTAWDAVQRRLSLAQGKVLGTTTLYNRGWLLTEIYEPWRRATARGEEHPYIDIIQFPSVINPAFPQDEFDRIKKTAPKWKFKMFYLGEFDTPPGTIYDIFNADENRPHVIPAFEIPNHWPRVVGVDPIGDKIGVVWLAYNPEENKLFLYREHLGEFGATIAGHARDVLRLSRDEPIIAFVGGQRSERQARVDWTAGGVPLICPPIHDFWNGVDRVYTLLKEHRLAVFDTCRNIINEFGTYSRVLDKSDNPTDKVRDKDAHHGLDSLRYIISWVTDPTIEKETLVYEPVQIGRNW